MERQHLRFEHVRANPYAITVALDLCFKGVSLRKIVDHLNPFEQVKANHVACAIAPDDRGSIEPPDFGTVAKRAPASSLAADALSALVSVPGTQLAANPQPDLRRGAASRDRRGVLPGYVDVASNRSNRRAD